MATEGPVLGKLLILYLDGVAVPCQTGVSVSISREMIEIACKGGITRKPGDVSISGSGSGNVTYDQSGGVIDLLKNITEDDPQPIPVLLTTEEDTDIEFDAYLSNVNIEAPVEGAATFDFDFVSSDNKLVSPVNSGSGDGNE